MKFWIIEILNSLCNDLYFVSNFFLSIVNLSWTLKTFGVGGGGEEGQFDPPCGFSKIVFCRNRKKPCFSWDFFFNIPFLIPSHIPPESFTEIPSVIQEIWRFYSSILPIFINFLDFFDITLLQMYNR